MTLAIYGAGGLGSDIYILAKQIEAEQKSCFNDIIYIVDKVSNDEFMGCKVLSFLDFTKKYNAQTAQVSIALGEPKYRTLLAEKIANNNFKLATLIHPSVYVCENTTIETGCIIPHGTFIGANTTIRENTVVISSNSSIGHDVYIGKNCVIGALCVIGGNTKLADNVYVGGGACIREKITIGEKAIVSMGAFISKNLEPKDVFIGNPAKFVRKNDNEKVFR